MNLNLQSEYKKLLLKNGNLELAECIDYLFETLPYLWLNEYMEKQSNRFTDVCRITLGTFDYVFDDSTTNEKKEIPIVESNIDSRLIAAFGVSNPIKKKRDDSRLRGWIGSTNVLLGEKWDKGHFIAHSIGGAVDGFELNVFRQRRDLNRGLSIEGRTFREMEKYCLQHSGTFCFNRPIYSDASSRPDFYEFGILKSSNELWVECFDNR